MQTASDLNTLVVTACLDIMEANIRRVQRRLDRLGLAHRPHVKTHKIPAIGKLQMQEGAVGIACQKLGEVEEFVAAGVADDILLCYPVIGHQKIERLMALTPRIRRLAVLDDEVAARELSKAGTDHGLNVRFLVECDT